MGTSIKIFTLFAFLILLPFLGSAQVDRAKIIGAYAYNFANSTYWYNEVNFNTFEILLISDKPDIIDEFQAFSKNRRIKDKQIVIHDMPIIPSAIDDEIRMVVLTKEALNQANDLYQKIQNKSILFLTESLTDKRNVMINLFESVNNELLFEVNRANILNHNLIIDPELLLLGGSEIDIADLYRTTQKALDEMQLNMALMTDSLKILNLRIEETLHDLKEQQIRIDEQKAVYEEQRMMLHAGQLEIEQRKGEVVRQQELIEQQQELLGRQKLSIDRQIEESQEQQQYIKTQREEIGKSLVVLENLKAETEEQKSALTEQLSVIQRQRVTIILAFIAGIMAILFLLTMIVSYRNKVKRNKLLREQKMNIENINLKLKTTNRRFFDIIARLRETQSQLITAEKMASLGVLTAGIAHEINNPINFIYTGINSLDKDYRDLIEMITQMEEQVLKTGDVHLIDSLESIKEQGGYNDISEIVPQTISDIKIGAVRAAEIVKGLRNFSRLDRDTKQIANVHEGIDSALLLLRNKFKNNITIVKDFQIVPDIECFPGKLNQVFMNILSNAIDAIEGDGVITIKTILKGNQLLISFHDNGKGIPAEILDKIFDPFFTTKTVGSGVGLGLSITYSIVQEHNGKIDVKSDKNNGTEFTISLPCNTDL